MTTDTSALIASPVDPDISAAMVLFDRMKPLQDALGVKDLTDGEMQVFAMVCHHTGLDPFTRQIYALKRGGKVTHQTGIDGYRSSAERTKQYRGTDEATFEECGCGDKDSPAEHPKLARVVVYRAYPDGIRPQVGVARWHELKPKHVRSPSAYGYPDDMWWQQPYNQLAKCAEAAALRKAFPRVFGGVYITEEMQQADVIEGEAERVVAPTAKERIAQRRADRQRPVISATGGNADAPNDGAVADVEEAVWTAEPDASAPVPSMTAAEFDRLARAAPHLTTAMVQAAHDELMPGVKGAEMSGEQWWVLAESLGLIEGEAA